MTSLELFFDLVFVLALTQCTTVMVDRPTWPGVGQAMILLGLLWWAWVGYTWVTSVLDPESGAVRLVMFAAMAAFLVAARAVPKAFGDDAMIFVGAYGVLRVAHVALAWFASREKPALRRSLRGLVVSTVLGVGLLLGGAFASGGTREVLWLTALVLDAGGAVNVGSAGWQLVSRHFAERHGLIVIIALGESIIAIGVGAGVALSTEVIIGAVLGLFLAASLWWVYFDVTSLVAVRRLSELPAGKEQNKLARDAYSYLHFPMVASVVLTAFALKSALSHISDPPHLVPAAALGGGVAIYLLSQVAFKRRAVSSWSMPRAVAALLLVALISVGRSVEAIGALAGALAVMIALILFETLRYADARVKERHHLLEHHGA